MTLAKSEVDFRHIIVHELNKSPKGEESTVLSMAPSPLNAEVKEFFEKRTAVTFSELGMEVRQSEDMKSPVPALARGHVSRPFTKAAFVQASQAAAKHLSTVQGKSASSGLLVVADATVRGSSALVFVKLEKSGGVRVQHRGSGANLVLAIEHIPDLMLTDNTKVFKVAIFSNDGEDVLVEVCDHQHPRGGTKPIADFFLGAFLGCEFLEEPKILTQKYLQAAQAFSTKHIDDPEERTKFHLAVVTALTSRSTRVRVREFARSHIEPKLQDTFVSSVKAKSIPLEFDKDTTLIEPTLKKMCMTFANGLALIGAPDAFKEDVEHKKGGVLVKSPVERVGTRR